MTSIQHSHLTLAKGHILLWKDSREQNTGVIKNKFFIVLGITDWVLIAVTTSQQHNRQRTHGCQENGKYYVLRQNKITWFDKDTWVILQQCTTQMMQTLAQKIRDGIITPIAKLPENETNAIIKCLRYSDDVSPAVIEEFLANRHIESKPAAASQNSR